MVLLRLTSLFPTVAATTFELTVPASSRILFMCVLSPVSTWLSVIKLSMDRLHPGLLLPTARLFVTE